MKRRTIALSLLLKAPLALPAVAQEPGVADERGRLTNDPATGEKVVHWWAQTGRTYFLQVSADLLHWNYAPSVIESGDDSLKEARFSTADPRSFVRVVWSDELTADPRAADFDGDGVSNGDELEAGTDPLRWADSDSDTLPDDWELRYGLDPEDGTDQTSDADDDGLTALQEFEANSNPRRRDSDKDGLSDGYESLAGTLATPHPSRPFGRNGPAGLVVFTPNPRPSDPVP